jgi:hypothetical protein
MSSLAKATVLISSIFLSGCSYVPVEESGVSAYVFSYTDNPNENIIELKLRSTSPKPFCLFLNDWPNASGDIEFHPGYISIVIDGNKVEAKNWHTSEYCPGGCAIKVKSGETITGFLRYEKLNIPISDYRKPKQLIMSPRPRRCS